MITLDFEQDILPVEEQIRLLREDPSEASAALAAKRLGALEKKRDSMLGKIYRNLDSWQTTQVARHADRPQTADYLSLVFSEFHEMRGDRMYADDRALISGMARIEGEPVMVIGHQKGRDTDDRIRHNFGMPHPEGYRKALRLMRTAEKFSLPLITLIDTPGAYCGIGAEERGMSQALGANLLALATLRTRVISAVIGEGGSGGALAIGVADRLLMFEHSVYSVISPEGCASILWKESGSEKLSEAAEAMRMRARDLRKLNLVDEIIGEPPGGAHRNPEAAAKSLGNALFLQLSSLKQLTIDECIALRGKKLREYGLFTERSGR